MSEQNYNLTMANPSWDCISEYILRFIEKHRGTWWNLLQRTPKWIRRARYISIYKTQLSTLSLLLVHLRITLLTKVNLHTTHHHTPLTFYRGDESPHWGRNYMLYPSKCYYRPVNIATCFENWLGWLPRVAPYFNDFLGHETRTISSWSAKSRGQIRSFTVTSVKSIPESRPYP